MGATAVKERGGGLSHIRDKVFDAVEHVVTWGLEHRTLGQIDASAGLTEVSWLLLKCSQNLGVEQRFRLRDLFRYDLRTSNP